MARAGFDPFTLELHKRLSGSRAFAGAADPLKVILQVAVEVAIEFKRHNPAGLEEFLRHARARLGNELAGVPLLLQNADQLQLACVLRELIRSAEPRR